VTALLALMKGLPLTFNSDFQEDKERLFDTLDTADWSLAAAIAVARGVNYRTDVMEAALGGGMLTATELADHLVRHGVPFRRAHHQVGEAVRLAEEGGMELWELDLETLRTCCPSAGDDVHEVLRPQAAVAAHDSPGGPAPVRVLEQLQEVDREVTSLEAWLDGRTDSPIRRAHLEERLLDTLLT
jgi:argininosuccinate lyase